MKSGPLISRLAHEMAMPIHSILQISRSAKYRYKRYFVPKRNGSGSREIAQPAREVKALQRLIVTILEPHLPVHWYAAAYKKGRSIKDNAEIHNKSRFLTKLDFKNFFPSIKSSDIQAHLELYSTELDLSTDEINLIKDIVLWKPPGRNEISLCIGAPSSPFLSNTVLYELDYRMSEWCEKESIKYSRYSDDVSLSSFEPDKLSYAERQLILELNALPYPRLQLNASKRVAVGRSAAMRVTGLTLSNQGDVTVGRKRKRGIRAGIHKYLHGRLEQGEVKKLRGELAFVLSVEPAFYERLARTYGENVIESLRSGNNTTA